MTTMRTAVLQCLVIFAAFGAAAANAGLENENLLITAPPGYKVGFNEKKPSMVMTEFVPSKETVENWTEMVTVQVFFGLKATPQQFMEDLAKRWRAACPETPEGHVIADAPENGYPTRVWLLDCPKNPQSGKPEITCSRLCRAMTASIWCKRRFVSSRAKSRSPSGWAISER